MTERYFSIDRDIEIEKAGGFFCHACVVGKTASKQSPDPRYCQSCYEVLKAEAKLLQGRKRPVWVPKTTDSAIKNTDNAPDGQGGVAKVIQPVTPPITEKKEIMKQRGRPRKDEGEVSRVTRWRRTKEGLQGVLV